MAQARLGNMHHRAWGTSQDNVEAHKWLNLGCARLSGDDQKQTVALRDEVAAQLTSAQLADAQKRAREWMEAFERRRP